MAFIVLSFLKYVIKIYALFICLIEMFHTKKVWSIFAYLFVSSLTVVLLRVAIAQQDWNCVTFSFKRTAAGKVS